MAEEELGIRSKREPPKLTTPYIMKTESYTPGLTVLPSQITRLSFSNGVWSRVTVDDVFQWCTSKVPWVRSPCPRATPLAAPSAPCTQSKLIVR